MLRPGNKAMPALLPLQMPPTFIIMALGCAEGLRATRAGAADRQAA
jgi:hypothetical protein